MGLLLKVTVPLATHSPKLPTPLLSCRQSKRSQILSCPVLQEVKLGPIETIPGNPVSGQHKHFLTRSVCLWSSELRQPCTTEADNSHHLFQPQDFLFCTYHWVCAALNILNHLLSSLAKEFYYS